MRPLPLLSLLAVVFLLLHALAGDEAGLPTDEQKLFEYATTHMNSREWREADRALQAYLARHPRGKWAEQATFYLGQVHVQYSRRHEVGREWLGKFCGRYPKAKWYWHARFLIAQSFQQQNLKERALEAYRALAKACPEENFRTSAAHSVFSLQDKYLRPWVNQSFAAGTKPEVRIGSRNVNAVQLRLYRLPFPDVIEHLEPGRRWLQGATAQVPPHQRKLIKEWQEFLWQPKRNYRTKNVALPTTDAGIYLVEVEHEGITFTVTVLVNRYGLVTKHAAGELLVFAQDPLSGAPVEGLRLRALHGQQEAEGITDASGLVKLAGIEETGFLVGSKLDGYVLGSSYASRHVPRRSLFYVFTDRPIYRPGQEVRFKIVHRVEEAGRLDLQEGLKLKVMVDDARGNRVHEGEYALNRFGSCHGALRLGEEPALGSYRIHVQPLAETAPVQGWWGQGLNDWGMFRVDEYRKPEFKVGVTFDRKRYIQGETLEATVRADYYFGSPVPDAAVSYRVFRRVHWYPWRQQHVWYDWYGEESARWYGGYGQPVHQGTGRTDAQGRLQLSYAIPREERDAQYTVVAQVTDLGRRRIDGSGAVLATQAEFGLQVELDRYIARPNLPFHVTLRARTHEGRPVADQAVGLRIYHRRWVAKRDQYEEHEVYRAAALTTDADGKAVVPLKIPQEGYMRLVAEATDRHGNRVRTHRYLWIASPGWGGGYMNFQGLDVVPDREAYEPGATATFLITSQAKDISLLFTLEGDRVHHHQVVRLTGHTATVEIKLDRPAYIPNVYVSVAALHRGQLYQRSKSIQVNPSERFLTVEITPDKPQYRPREKATFQITTRDRDGRPVSAEVALGAVDESIYALQPEFAADIRRFFVRKRWNRVQSGSSLQFWDHGRVAEESEDAAVPPGVRAPAAEGLARNARQKKKGGLVAPTEIRARFADTMLWSPTVVTDADGRATVTLDQIADNLTTWRVTARGISARGLVGQEQEPILVRKNVIVRLQTPRFFTQGDRSYVTAVVRNDLAGAKEVKVVLEAEGIEVDGAREVTVQIGAREERRLDWTAYVGAPGRAKLTVQALTDEESDAMRLEVPVLPHGSLQWKSSAGLVEDEVRTRITLPEKSIREASELLVVVSPSHAATVLDALDYLAGYPYGCVEQTMSRFLPTAITRQVLQQLRIKKPDLEAELPHMLRTGLQRLYNFQHRDGGWGWWKHDQSNPFTTAYVVYGLALAREADVAVDPQVLQRAIQALQRQLQQAKDDETRAYALYALSVAGVQQPAVRNALADRVANLPAATKAMLALVLHRDGEAREAKRVLAALVAEAVEIGAGAHWRGQKAYRWTSHAVETTALGLKALLAIDPDHALVRRVVVWLAMSRDGRHWVSTRQTAMVVYALADYLARTGEREPDMTLTLEVNGRRLYAKRVTRENWHAFDGTVRLEGSLLRPGDNEIVFRKEGTGTPVYALYLKHFAQADAFAPSQGGLQVARQYALVTQEKGKRKLVPLGDGAQVKSGDEIEVTLTVRADRVYRYLILEDPMPAGCEAIREERPRWYGRPWRYWYANKEFRDEKVDIAVTYLPEGERTVSYLMRAETPGAFRVLPALVWNMYRPGEGGNSAGATLRVVD
ncbi:MAG: alpha-2-macroglobulin family protein [Planctomycetota bacterium]|jgi:uncharacterized protein YfaS (alpha-2-macroglobulin family)